MSDARDPRDDLRRLIDSVEPVTESEARERAEADPSVGALDPADGGGRRGFLLAAAAVLAVLVLGGALLVWQGGNDDPDVTTGPATTTPTTLGPATTVLEPVGDDPIVSCDPWANEWYPLSAWSRPVGDEFADDPASTALRNYLLLMQGYNTRQPPDPDALVPTFRRLSETDTRVLFGSGDLDLEQVAADTIGPNIGVAKIELVDGNWRWSGAGSGTCNELFTFPGDSRTFIHWGIADDQPSLSPDTTEIPIVTSSWIFPCGPAVTADEVLGPDVVETDESVTIRLALDIPPPDDEDAACSDGFGDVEELSEAPPIEVTAHLRAPLGDRVLLDGNQYPAAEIDLTPEPEEPPPPPDRRIELPGGTIEVSVDVLGNHEGLCDTDEPDSCGVPSQTAQLTVSAGGEAITGRTNDIGRATLVLPDGPFTIRADSDRSWCPTVTYASPTVRPNVTIACTRLELPHATVSGRLAATGEGDGWLVTFVRTDLPLRSMAQPASPDGEFEVTLEQGLWSVGVVNTNGTITCNVEPPGDIEVVGGEDQTLDLTCS